MEILERNGHRPHSMRGIEVDYIVDLTQHVYDNPILCSLLSYFVRAERTMYPEEFISAGIETINKEIVATQGPNVPQQLDYTSLFTDEECIPIHSSTGLVPNNTIRTWKKNLTAMIHHFKNSSTPLILPH